jgi:GDP-L-fucose synthase
MKYLIAGHTGLVGSALCKRMDELSLEYVGASSKRVDFRDLAKTNALLKDEKPDCLIIAAAHVGGIKANNDFPVEFLVNNLQIGINLITAANSSDIKKVIYLASSCIYPKYANQPIVESDLLTGALEPTNQAYAIAKIACVELIDSYRREYGKSWFSVMPTNLYGKNDNFDLESSHVLPALLSKIHSAKINNLNEVSIWGTGLPKREFMHASDLADAIIFLSKIDPIYSLINVGTGSDLTILELAELISKVVGFDGKFVFDSSFPDGTPRKLMDNTRITSLGWKPAIDLEDGIRDLYEWYLSNNG